MRLVLVAVLLTIGTPAVAQFTSHPTAPEPAPPRFSTSRSPSYGPSPDVYRQIDRERRAGTLSRGEAHKLRRAAALNDEIASRFGSDGFSDSEQQEIDFRNAALRSQAAAVATQPPKH
jgi:hypothetical protein